MATLTVFGREVKPEVGSIIRFDGTSVRRFLMPGDAPVDDSYRGFEFRITSSLFATGIPVDVTISGRTPQRYNGELWIRVRLECVKDGDPSTFTHAWLKV